VSRLKLSDAATLFHADCREALKTLADNSLDSCVTDPPYALVSMVKRFGGASLQDDTQTSERSRNGADGMARLARGFMGSTWDNGETAFSTEFWQQVYRVLKPGAFVAAFGASRQYHRMACAIEDAGFEIRDSLMWVYGTGFPKSHDVSKGIDREAGAVREVVGEGEPFGRGSIRNKSRVEAGYRPIELNPEGGVSQITAPATPQAAEWEGWGTALKPAFEPIVLARKPLSEGTVAANVLRWRTGALNIGASRVPSPDGVARVQYHKTGAESMFSGINGGTLVDPSFDGRWPANVVHDGSDEVVGAFPNTKSGSFNGERSADKFRGVYGAFKGAKGEREYQGNEGSAARFFFNASESDEQWVARNSGKCVANDAPSSFSLLSELAVSALSRAVAQSMPQLVLTSTVSPALSMNVTPSELKRLSETLTETIQSIERKCLHEPLPVRLSLSDSLVNIAVVCERIDTIMITISPSKSSGCVEPAIFSITRQNSAVGVKDCVPSSARFHYSAKASKADRAGSKHPTVKPIALMEWLCTLITPPGGTILDPFAGSGTTGIAATRRGFSVLLCEREAEYVQDIRSRFGSRRVLDLSALLADATLLPALHELQARLACS
jgi:DNA modification methylase